MIRKFQESSIFVVGLALLGGLMFVPAVIASYQDHDHEARSFFYGAIIILTLMSFLILASGGRRPVQAGKTALQQLVEVILAFALFPVFLAVPLQEALQNTRFLNAYFEMFSALSGSGASIFQTEGRLIPAIALWRAIVAWVGILIILSSVVSIFLPLNIAGYELREQESTARQFHFTQSTTTISQILFKIAPVFAMLTFAVWAFLLLLGASPLEAAFHAFTLVSLCGFEWQGETALNSLTYEYFCAIVILAILGHRQLGEKISKGRQKLPWNFIEIRMVVILCSALALVASFFHLYWGAVFDRFPGFISIMKILWGQFYTMLSFSATFGHESIAWGAGAQVSGLQTANMILIALATIGGSAAGAAGGVKLVRVFVLWIGLRDELERMTLPSLIPRQNLRRIGLSSQAPELAWVFFMIFVLAFAVVSLAFGALGHSFESAIIFAASALSTTGPLLNFSAEGMAGFATSTDMTKIFYMLALFAGRFELLAFLVLFSPTLWRS